MSQVQVSYGQLAEVALSVMGQAKIQADDHTIEMVRATRAFLRMVRDGELLISLPETVPAGGPAAQSEGVFPAGSIIS